MPLELGAYTNSSNGKLPGRRRFLFGVLLTLFSSLAVPIFGLDISLNDRNHAVISSDELFAQSMRMRAAGDLPAIPLQALYPYMESVEYLEVQSGINRVFWDASRLGSADWDGALLAYRDGEWEVRVGRDVFSSPDRISIRGLPLNVGTIRIWYSPETSLDGDQLRAALSLRGVKSEWREVSQMAHLLSDPPKGALPHLILTSDLDILRLGETIANSGAYGQRASQWIAAPVTSAAVSTMANPADQQADNGTPGTTALMPFAMNAYHPDSALVFLLGDNPELFDESGEAILPSSLTAVLANAATAGKSGRLVVTDNPVMALDERRALSALLLPEDNLLASQYSARSGPNGTIRLIRRHYAGVPAGLRLPERKSADLVLADALRFADLQVFEGGVVLPMKKRVPRFYDAYERIGRLAISGEISSEVATGLINQYLSQ